MFEERELEMLWNSEELQDAYSEEEKKAILEGAPYTLGIVGQKSARRLMKMAAEDREYYLHNPPVVAGYEVTHECNLKCLHCYNASGCAEQFELNTEEAKIVIDQAHDLGCCSIIFGGGEAFMRKDFLDIVEYADRNDLDMAISTNCTLIDRKTAKHLSDFHIYNIETGIDGTEEVHDRIRGAKGAWKRTYNAIYHLLDAGIPVVALYTVMRSNVHHIEEYIDFMKDEFGDVVHLIFMRTTYAGRAISTGEFLSPIEWLHACHRITRKLKIENWSGIPYYYILDSSRQSRVIKEFMRTPVGQQIYPAEMLEDVLEKGIPVEEAAYKLLGGVCKAGLWQISVNPQGDIVPCARMGGVSLGNIRETTLEEVWWNSEMIQKLKNRHRQIKGKCKTCKWMEWCGGGGRTDALKFFGDILAEDPGCIPPEHQKDISCTFS
ncbi:MAG: hypothetical protein AYK19_09645 [Theionarchaea archaeon DG-70-1]|nr:MAG: hypothetical protein AYK19_09645 [Theionarchaea archaeon DG-70-1]